VVRQDGGELMVPSLICRPVTTAADSRSGREERPVEVTNPRGKTDAVDIFASKPLAPILLYCKIVTFCEQISRLAL